MKNKKLFLLPLFLLLPYATQCMEPIKEITVAKPKTMQEIRDERDAIYQKILILQNLLFLSEIEIPQDVINLISLLMFNLEESLL